jgi:hypothetical protein
MPAKPPPTTSARLMMGLKGVSGFLAAGARKRRGSHAGI